MESSELRDSWVLPIIAELASHEAASRAAHTRSGSAWEEALRLGVVSEADLLAAISRKLSTPVVTSLSVTDEAKVLLPERTARKYRVVPLSVSPHTLDVATANPWDLDAERSVAFVSGKSVRMWLASPPAVAAALDAAYGSAEIESGRDTRTDDLDAEPVVRLVDRIVSAGIDQGASDIHLEPEEDGIAVRYRIDGLLRHTMILPKAVGIPLVSRIKIMARLDIADRLRPQGGHASVGVGIRRIDLRVSTLPASHGEKVVIRILDPSAAVRSLDSLGLDDTNRNRLNQLLDTREGLVLVTGPTGSGKTTTLYAALRQVQRRGLNIITVEDPVEYRIPGIVQVQINEKAGLSFASALRSILRQDPDVVLIGEIRDRETAAIAIQASLTGHLVFATLHTNDACSSITRLTDLGVDSSRLAAALKGVVAQRLIRRLCPDCRIVANDGVPAQITSTVSTHLMVYTAVGCDRCGMSGYRGRIAVSEIVVADSELERGIVAGASVDVLTAIARRSGCQSLWESGVEHLAAGDTTGDELLRVLEQNAPTEPDRRAPDESRAVQVDEFDSRHEAPNLDNAEKIVTSVTPGVVDVYVIRPLADGWKVLTVQRANDTRCPGAWETIHGRLDPEERPEDGAIREVREETGLTVSRLYNVTVQPFYLHMFGTVQLAIVFCAFVDEPADVTLGDEHQSYEWLSPHDASSRFIWPREREALSHILHLLAGGNAGPVEDVLRVI
jgi:type II secretory ATPase GspE/PulE/Tfp pilus assembly ATPase PilB-like protein/8-oxo-dGTP pyrophosphatase MutT (NUDIX family)